MMEQESPPATDWMPGYSNGFLLAFAMSVANQEEMDAIAKALEEEESK